MDKYKRNLAKALGITGMGAAVWKQPVVTSVVIPAHASTSNCGTLNLVYSGTVDAAHEASGSYALFESGCESPAIEEDSFEISTGSVGIDLPLNVSPGSYHLIAYADIGGSTGSSEVTIELSCCDAAPAASDTDTLVDDSGNGNPLVLAEITIGDDLGCSITQLTQNQWPGTCPL